MKCCVYHTNILIIHYILFSALFKVLRSIFSDVCIFNVNGEYFWLKYLTYLIFPELLATILEFFPKPASSPPLPPPHSPFGWSATRTRGVGNSFVPLHVDGMCKCMLIWRSLNTKICWLYCQLRPGSLSFASLIGWLVKPYGLDLIC